MNQTTSENQRSSENLQRLNAICYAYQLSQSPINSAKSIDFYRLVQSTVVEALQTGNPKICQETWQIVQLAMVVKLSSSTFLNDKLMSHLRALVFMAETSMSAELISKIGKPSHITWIVAHFLLMRIAPPAWIIQQGKRLSAEIEDSTLQAMLLILADRAIRALQAQDQATHDACIDAGKSLMGKTLEGDVAIWDAMNDARMVKEMLLGTEPWKREKDNQRRQKFAENLKLCAMEASQIGDELLRAPPEMRREIARKLLIALEMALPATKIMLGGSAASYIMGRTSTAPSDIDLFGFQDTARLDHYTPNQLSWSQVMMSGIREGLRELRSISIEDKEEEAINTFESMIVKATAPKQKPELQQRRHMACMAGILTFTEQLSRINQGEKLDIDKLQQTNDLLGSSGELEVSSVTNSYQLAGMRSRYIERTVDYRSMFIWNIGHLQIIDGREIPQEGRHLSTNNIAETATAVLHSFDIPTHRCGMWIENNELQELDLSHLGYTHPSLSWKADAGRFIKAHERGYPIPPALLSVAMMLNTEWEILRELRWEAIMELPDGPGAYQLNRDAMEYQLLAPRSILHAERGNIRLERTTRGMICPFLSLQKAWHSEGREGVRKLCERTINKQMQIIERQYHNDELSDWLDALDRTNAIYQVWADNSRMLN